MRKFLTGLLATITLTTGLVVGSAGVAQALPSPCLSEKVGSSTVRAQCTGGTGQWRLVIKCSNGIDGATGWWRPSYTWRSISCLSGSTVTSYSIQRRD